MEEAFSFEEVLSGIQRRSNRRDPRSVRLSSVTAALIEVIQGEGMDVSAARFYSKAVATLDGTVQHQPESLERLVDSLCTQNSLLDLLTFTLPHTDPAIVAATLPGTSRTLRKTLKQTMAIDPGHGILDTNDDLGKIPSVLSAICKTSSELIRSITKSNESIVEGVLLSFFRETLMRLFNDKRARVRKIARDEILGLLSMEFTAHSTLISKSINSKLIDSLTSLSAEDRLERVSKDLMDLLQFAQLAIPFIDSIVLGEKLMVVLVDLFDRRCSSSSGDQSFTTKPSTEILALINGLLSTILVLLEDDCNAEAKTHFAARVLATLLQAKPTLVFNNADVELGDGGRLVYGQVSLSAVQRLLQRDIEKGCRLLSLTIDLLLNLSNCTSDDSRESATETLFTGLSQILRHDLSKIQAKNAPCHSLCCRSSLAILKRTLEPSENILYHAQMLCIGLLLQQMESTDELATGCLKKIVMLRARREVDKNSIFALDEGISCVLQGIGVESFWKWVDFSSLCIQGSRSDQMAWLFKILRASALFSMGASHSLAFFMDNVLPLARHFDTRSVEKPEDKVACRGCVVDLWSLFSCFCLEPVDIQTTLPGLIPILLRAMKDERYPEIITSVANGLDLLSSELNKRLGGIISDDVKAKYQADVSVLSQLCERLLPSLFKLVDDIYDGKWREGGTQQRIGCSDTKSSQINALTGSIAALAKLAPSPLLQNIFSKVIQKLLVASQADEDLTEKMFSLLSLSHALVSSQSLDDSSILLLYRSLRPLIRTDETPAGVQKRAYKLLVELCKSESFVISDGRLPELLELLTTSSPTSQIAARLMRIRCLEKVCEALRASRTVDEAAYTSILGETLLCMKDSNNRTRGAAHKLLLSLIEVKGDVVYLIRAITAAIASETSHMRSAAIVALSIVLFEHGKNDSRIQDLFPSILRTVLLLAEDPSREVTKSVVGFVRVAVVACPPESLQPLVAEVLGALLGHRRGRDRFRGKIKIIIKKLVRMYGYDFLFPLVPESESRLLVHMKKLSVREARKKKSGIGKCARPTDLDELLGSDEDDSDEGRTFVSGTTKHTMASAATSKKSLKRGRSSYRELDDRTQRSEIAFKSTPEVLIRNDTGGNEFDVRDLTKRTVRFLEASDESASDDDIAFDQSGRLVITENYNEESSIKAEECPEKSTAYLDSSVQRPLRRPREHNKLGGKYKAKKAGGDLRRKGQKYDPYAYVPLDGRSYSKKNRRGAVEQMGSVVNRARKRQKR